MADESSEYQCVLHNLDNIATQLEALPAAKDRLTRKFKSKEWLGLTAKPTEEELVTVALVRIQQDSSQYGEFVHMFQDIPEMDLLVKTLTGISCYVLTNSKSFLT